MITINLMPEEKATKFVNDVSLVVYGEGNSLFGKVVSYQKAKVIALKYANEMLLLNIKDKILINDSVVYEYMRYWSEFIEAVNKL